MIVPPATIHTLFKTQNTVVKVQESFSYSFTFLFVFLESFKKGERKTKMVKKVLKVDSFVGKGN